MIMTTSAHLDEDADKELTVNIATKELGTNHITVKQDYKEMTFFVATKQQARKIGDAFHRLANRNFD